MDNWLINHADGSTEHFTGDREAVAAHLEARYPGKHVEAFTDQVLVYEPEVADGETIDGDPMASAIPED